MSNWNKDIAPAIVEATFEPVATESFEAAPAVVDGGWDAGNSGGW